MTLSKDKPPVLAIACGGTGGHFFPGLSIAREFQRRGGKSVLFLGGHHSGEQIRTASTMGVHAIASPSVRIPRNMLKWPYAGVRFLMCQKANKQLLQEQQATVAMAMGSFASVPMGRAATSLKLPLFLHEGNARLGRANRLLSRKADKLYLSLPLYGGEQTHAKQHVVGMPTRQQIRDAAEKPVTREMRAKICEKLKLSPDLPILLVFGGSQGAHFLNQLLPETASLLKDDKSKFQLIHLTGSKHTDDYDLLYKQMGIKCYVAKRESRIEQLYMVADLVLCRAGASTIFELALFGKPSILVPFPAAMDDHQTANAMTLVDTNSAMMFEERTLTPDATLGRIKHWLAHPDEYRTYGENIRQFARPGATKETVDDMCASLGLSEMQSEG